MTSPLTRHPVTGSPHPVAAPLGHPLASSRPPRPRRPTGLSSRLTTQTFPLPQQVHSP